MRTLLPLAFDGHMIDITNVVKRHGSRTVLREISFQAHPGRITAFLGPNGAGKSSTLRILLGLDRADSGRALIAGQAYRELQNPLRTVGSMLDGPGAHRSRRAAHHLGWLAASNGLGRHRIAEVLDRLGLANDAKKRVGTFSLGMCQRLGLAAALLGEPDILVLDEPVNGLDPAGIRLIRQILRAHADDGGTVLLSSHLMGEVSGLADDVVMIASGQVVKTGTLAQVTAGYPDLETAFFDLTEDELQ